jgi:NADH:ubiquinone oxidoreductase subunit H
MVGQQKDHVWNIFKQPLGFLIFLVCAFAETNRTPFDLPEAEAELVSGYNVEYSAFTFALFFLAEYSHILFASALTTICFFGGWYIFGVSSFLFFVLKQFLLTISYIWIRATLPRYRFDQLMQLGWKNILPLSFSYFLLVSGIFFSYQYV